MTALLAQEGRPFFRWDWVISHLDDIRDRLLEHLYLTSIAVGTGLAIALVLSVVVLRWRRAYGPIIGLTGTMYTIPSLALFALLVPITGLSVTTAEVALVSYTLLILVRNIVTGIDGVPKAVKEAATGMGYRPARRFLEIELPLALPVIVAGIRIASVTVVGLVTVTALIGQGGLGRFILDGIRSVSIPFPTPIIVGTALSVLRAGLLDLVLFLVQRALTPWARRRVAT